MCAFYCMLRCRPKFCLQATPSPSDLFLRPLPSFGFVGLRQRTPKKPKQKRHHTIAILPAKQPLSLFLSLSHVLLLSFVSTLHSFVHSFIYNSKRAIQSNTTQHNTINRPNDDDDDDHHYHTVKNGSEYDNDGFDERRRLGVRSGSLQYR